MKILVVGSGSIGQRHLHNFLKIRDVRCSVCDPDRAKLNAIGKEYRVDRVFTSFKEIDLSCFDALIICTPPHMHLPMALRGADAGCHLFVEKPLSYKMDDIDRLIELAKEKNIVAGCAYVFRHHPVYVKIKELLREKRIGKINLAILKSGQPFAFHRPDYRKIYFAKKKMGGGVILDLLSHSLNFIQWCFGEEKEIVCFYGHLSRMEIETEDVGMMLLQYEDNIFVQLHANAFQKDDSVYVEFIGSEGTIRMGGDIRQDSSITEIGIYKDRKKGWDRISFPRIERDDIFFAQAEHFIRAIKGEEKVMTTLEEAKQTLKICLLAKRSYEEGRIIKL